MTKNRTAKLAQRIPV